MRLEKVHLDILGYLYDNLPEDESLQGDISRKVLFKSVNFKPRQIERACKELKEQGFVTLHEGFYSKDWSSIAITDPGIDQVDLAE